jgi:hypothetical protein
MSELNDVEKAFKSVEKRIMNVCEGMTDDFSGVSLVTGADFQTLLVGLDVNAEELSEACEVLAVAIDALVRGGIPPEMVLPSVLTQAFMAGALHQQAMDQKNKIG